MADHMRWACGEHVFDLATPKILAILNVTPDSFSDGGRYVSDSQGTGDHQSAGQQVNVEAAVEKALELVAQGADIVDVGGESTRPGARFVSAQEEIERIVPVVDALSSEGVVVSVDTYKPQTAAAALAAGASIINDITGFTDPLMVDVSAGDTEDENGPGLIVMHMKGVPQTMQNDPRYEDVVGEVRSFLQGRLNELQFSGIKRERIALDPGFGFGKTDANNLEILRHTHDFATLGQPLVVAVSRKRTIGNVLGVDVPKDRVMGSMAAALYAVERGARIVRVHDVVQARQAIDIFSELAVGGE